ncbi:dynein beta chain, ciliary-like [Myzus persicae]|uniref:dynein beta chain, ciliary-like n=1 Tax=Myzus persicae TaxID=13164 RepID=UPI000B939B66|nr:dynein beta chain, ciliary-like [Myzus persicae]
MDMMRKVEEQPPYVIVSLRECVRMNWSMNEIRSSLKDLPSGLKWNDDVCNHIKYDDENYLGLIYNMLTNG